METKKVVVLGPALDVPGGIASVVMTLADTPLFRVFEITYLACYETPSIGRQLRGIGRAAQKLLALLLRRDIALVHAHSASRGISGASPCSVHPDGCSAFPTYSRCTAESFRTITQAAVRSGGGGSDTRCTMPPPLRPLDSDERTLVAAWNTRLAQLLGSSARRMR